MKMLLLLPTCSQLAHCMGYLSGQELLEHQPTMAECFTSVQMKKNEMIVFHLCGLTNGRVLVLSSLHQEGGVLGRGVDQGEGQGAEEVGGVGGVDQGAELIGVEEETEQLGLAMWMEEEASLSMLQVWFDL